MNTRLAPLLAILLTSALALPASAGGVYRSVGADGAILFSDMPPPSEASIVAQGRAGGTISAVTAPGMPYYELAESSEAVTRANAQVDLSEHAFALSRQGLWSPRDGLRLVAARMTRDDEQRVAFYKKDLQAARQQLMDLLHERQAPVEVAAR